MVVAQGQEEEETFQKQVENIGAYADPGARAPGSLCQRRGEGYSRLGKQGNRWAVERVTLDLMDDQP